MRAIQTGRAVTMRLQWLALLAVVATPATAAPETAFGFVSVYLREIASIDEYRAQAAANQAAQPHDMAGCVHDTEAWQLEVKGASSALGAMTLPASNPAQQAPQLIAEGLSDKAQSINEIEEVCAAMIALVMAWITAQWWQGRQGRGRG